MTEFKTYPIQEAIRLIKKAKTVHVFCMFNYAATDEHPEICAQACFLLPTPNFDRSRYVSLSQGNKEDLITALELRGAKDETKAIALIEFGTDIFISNRYS